MPGVEIARARILNLKHISKPVRTYSIRQERHQTEAARSAHIPFRPSGKGTETAPTVNTSIGSVSADQ